MKTMNTHRVRALTAAAAFGMLLLGSMTAFAEDGETYTRGYVVEEASEENLNGEFGEAYQAAGFQVTFTYIAEEDEDVTGVDVYSDFQWYSPEAKQIFADNEYVGYTTPSSAYQYREGYARTSYGSPVPARSADLNLYGKEGLYSEAAGYIFYPMEEVSDGVYQVTMPIPAGEYRYVYRLHASDESTLQVKDPSDEVDWYTTSTYKDTPNYWSLFYVGTADDVEGDEKYWYEGVEDDKKGTVVTDELECITGSVQQIEIYEPYNYDPDSEEPYKVIYINHGATENETVWMTIGNVPTIMDNMIAEGLISDHVLVVTVDNATSFSFSIYGEQSDIVENNMNYVVPYVTEHYNVSDDPENIVMCGDSAGAIATFTMLTTYPDAFSAFGIFSIPGTGDFSFEQALNVYNSADKIYIGGGTLEKKETSGSVAVYNRMVEQAGCTDLEYHWVDGAHDFVTWRQLFVDFIRFIDWAE